VRPRLAGAVRLRRRRVATRGGSVIVFVVSIFVILRAELRDALAGCGFGVSVPVWARQASEDGPLVEEGAVEKRATAEAAQTVGIVSGVEQVSRALERAGSGEGVVGPTTVVGDRTVIPLIETFASGGFGGGTGGSGQGEGGGGGGGGGVGRSRTVAIAIAGPEGVTIRPVIDVTGLALPAVTAVAALLLGRRRRRRWR
jgi:hypothetical protein